MYFSDLSFCVYLTHTILYFYLIAKGGFGLAGWKGFIPGCLISIVLSWINYIVFNKVCIICRNIRSAT